MELSMSSARQRHWWRSISPSICRTLGSGVRSSSSCAIVCPGSVVRAQGSGEGFYGVVTLDDVRSWCRAGRGPDLVTGFVAVGSPQVM